MKNLYIFVVAIIALVASVNTAAAQRVDTVYIEKEVVSAAPIIGAAATANNQVGCTEPVFVDGVLVTDRHAGSKFGVELCYNYTHYTSDLVDGDNTQGFGAAVTYSHEWCQKTWAIAPVLGAYLGGMTSRTYENLETGFNVFGGVKAGIVIAPHSARINVNVLMQFNCITHSNINGDPHKLYVPQPGVEIGSELKIGNRVRSGVTDAYGYKLQTKEKNPIYLGWFVRGTMWETSKKWDTSNAGDHKIKGFSIEAGVRLNLNFNIYKKH